MAEIRKLVAKARNRMAEIRKLVAKARKLTYVSMFS